MILGLGLFGTFATSLTAAMTKSHTDVSNRELLERIEVMEDRLTRFLNRRDGNGVPPKPTTIRWSGSNAQGST